MTLDEVDYAVTPLLVVYVQQGFGRPSQFPGLLLGELVSLPIPPGGPPNSTPRRLSNC